MHPVIRLIAFVTLCVFLVSGNASQLMAASIMLYAFYVNTKVSLSSAWPALWRVRWLWLSLWVMYFGITPGEPLLPDLASLPTVEGVQEGLLRTASLALLVLGAHLLFHSTPREDLLAGLLWLTTPVVWSRATRERLALRIILTLQGVVAVQQLLGQGTQQQDEASSPFTRISNRAAEILREIVRRAETAPCVTLEIPQPNAPPAYQWCYLIVLAALLWAAKQGTALLTL